ncbi:MAG: hypothetical protein ACON5H_10205 [Akkermansiaceae bacterium]
MRQLFFVSDPPEDFVAVRGRIDDGEFVGRMGGGEEGDDRTIFYGLNNAGLADQWLTAETGISNPSPSDWLVDYDHDGVSAHLEYAFGGSNSTSDRALLPQMRPDGAGGFELIFNRRQSGISLSDYIIETSSTLQPTDWKEFSGGGINATAHPDLSGFDQVLVPLSDIDSLRFFRMKIR